MVDTLDLKSRLAKLRLAGVQQDQHVKRKIQDDNEWEDIKRESYEEPQPAYPEEMDLTRSKVPITQWHSSMDAEDNPPYKEEMDLTRSKGQVE